MVKILTIEDSAFERKVIKNILRKGGYKDVLEASNGKEGMDVYRKEKPAIVLLDLRMPGEPTGLDVITALKNIDSRARIIIVSIVRQQESIDEAMKLGALKYIVKPVTEEKLLSAVKEVLK